MPLDWSIYADGFAEAAELLVKHATRANRNRVVFPVIFNYRQALELTLKYGLILASDLADQDSPKLNKHSLLAYWKPLRPLLEKQWSDASKEPLNALDELIDEFDKMDANSQRFRYPTRRINGGEEPSFEADLLVNLENFAAVCRQAYDFLRGTVCAMEEAIHVLEENRSCN